MELPVVGAGHDDPLAVGRRSHVRRPEIVVGRRVPGVEVVPEVRGRGPHRHRRGAEDVAQLPVLDVAGAFPPDVAVA